MKVQHASFHLMVLVGSALCLSPSAAAQGSLEKVAVSLHHNWFVQSSANVTASGATISTPGFSTTGWLKTSIPATPVGWSGSCGRKGLWILDIRRARPEHSAKSGDGVERGAAR